MDLGIWYWVVAQKINYKQRLGIMANEPTRKTWEYMRARYRNYIEADKWCIQHARLIAYMEANNKIPSTVDKNPVISKLAVWARNQKHNYTKKLQRMSTRFVRAEWESTTAKYHKHMN